MFGIALDVSRADGIGELTENRRLIGDLFSRISLFSNIYIYIYIYIYVYLSACGKDNDVMLWPSGTLLLC